jgi:hypothetical protein
MQRFAWAIELHDRDHRINHRRFLSRNASDVTNALPLPKCAMAVTGLHSETSVSDARYIRETEERHMRKISMIAASVALVATSAGPAMTPASAHASSRYHVHHYKGHTHYARKYCRRSSGTTGLVAGGVGGALVGRSVLGHGLLGTAAGAVGGAVAGRAIDRSMTARSRCYWR